MHGGTEMLESITPPITTPHVATPHVTTPSPEDVAKAQRKFKKRKLVRRQHAWSIAAAWIITVPLAAGLSAILYHVMRALGVVAI
jgi:PiT family inorganic phosphate transporter